MTINFKNSIKWSPYSKYGYATGRLMTITFNTKEECDNWVNENNSVYPGCLQYKSLPYILPNDLLNAEILINN